jgi:hypothetical protein
VAEAAVLQVAAGEAAGAAAGTAAADDVSFTSDNIANGYYELDGVLIILD